MPVKVYFKVLQRRLAAARWRKFDYAWVSVASHGKNGAQDWRLARCDIANNTAGALGHKRLAQASGWALINRQICIPPHHLWSEPLGREQEGEDYRPRQ